MGRIGRSYQLVGQSYRILMQDKELMVLPLISGVFITIAVVVMAAGFGLSASHLPQRGPGLYIPTFLFYVVTYAIGIFFQAAVVAATVGMIIRAIHNRVSFIGKILASLMGAAWSLATFFVVPVLVLEDRSIPESFKRSVSVFRETWGETVVGGTTLGAAALCAWFTLIAVTGLLAWAVGIAALVVGVIGAVALMVFFSALQGVYVASLYRFATGGGATAGLDPTLLGQTFMPKAR
jgi:hypothetical protein